jgi:hypothetical protein
MATASATIDQSLNDATAATRQAAASQGWAWKEGDSSPGKLVFSKNISLFSLGSRMTVQLQSSSPSETRVTVSTKTLAVFDAGRSGRAADELLVGLGAQKD